MTADATVAHVLRWQRDGCRAAGSPLYAHLLDAALADVERGGPVASVLHDPGPDPHDSAYALRFMGGVHRIVLEGRAPELAAYFPSAGGRFDPDRDDPAPAFLAFVHAHRDELLAALDRGVQTNEVGRCAALIVGFLEVLRRFGRPLRIREIGASGGLNLRWDHYRYEGGRDGTAFGDPASRLCFAGFYRAPGPDLELGTRGEAVVADRRGCDRSPIDPTTEEGRLTLLSFVWPDQVERVARLEAAIEVARAVPVTVDRADAAGWVAAQLAEVAPGTATVLYHSIVWQYLDAATRASVRAAIEAAGASATPGSPLAWLRFEPAGDPSRGAEVRLTTWPGGDDRLLTRGGYHGPPIRLVQRP